jgi:hypothetical protein
MPPRLDPRCGIPSPPRPRSSENSHRYVAHYTWLFFQAYTALLPPGSPQLWFWVASLSLCPMAPRRLLAPPAARDTTCPLAVGVDSRHDPSASLAPSNRFPRFTFRAASFSVSDRVQPLPQRRQLLSPSPWPSPSPSHATCSPQPAICNLQPESAICNLQPHTSKVPTPCLSSTVAQTDI